MIHSQRSGRKLPKGRTRGCRRRRFVSKVPELGLSAGQTPRRRAEG